MRLAILSDIHGNLVALQAVLSDLQRKKVDQILCLGDVAATGPQPCEVIETIEPLKWPTVMGNSDEALANNVLDPQHEKALEQMPEVEKKRMLKLDLWTRKQLTKSHMAFLSTFQPTVTYALKNRGRLLCYHGSPRSNKEGILATTPDDELTNYLAGREADVFAGGHTHTQMLRQFRGSLVVNPGSVGLPLEQDSSDRVRNPARAEYALVNVDEKSFGFEFLRVPYSKADLQTTVRESGLPNGDWWLADWYAPQAMS